MRKGLVGIVGGGLMGAGIAVKFALAGHEVFLLEASPERRNSLPDVIAGILGELQEAGALSANERQATQTLITLIDELTALEAATVVVEAIPEILEAKQALYREMENVLSAKTLIASNTSGLMPDALSAGMAKPERFLIAHFWNPPHAIPLVEVVPSPRTLPAAVDQLVTMLRGIAAEPVVLRKAVPGFIGNRLQFAIMREALHLVQSGVADPATVDTVMKSSLGRRYGIVGPFEAADLGGLETFLRVASNLIPELAHGAQSLDLLRERVERGEKGAASGQGFYQWTDERRAEVRRKRIQQHLKPGAPSKE
jgi:3-hydroxybutyryl-CoA dehydrogenase